MIMLNRKIILFCLLFLYGVAGVGTPVTDYSLFQMIVEHNSKVTSIESHIDQEIWNGDNPPEKFSGLFRADSRGRFRIDYSMPENQVVINDGKKLYWYYPADRLLYEIASHRDSGAPKLNPLEEYSKGLEVRYRVSNMGRTVYGFFSISDLYLLIDKQSGVTIHLWIDSFRGLVNRKVVTGRDGVEIIRETYEGYESIEGIYFPSRVEVLVRTPGGVTGNSTIYRRVRLNIPMDERIFNMQFPPDVKKKYLDEK